VGFLDQTVPVFHAAWKCFFPVTGGIVAAGIEPDRPVLTWSLLRADALSAYMIAIVTLAVKVVIIPNV
jgi:hypothetical protein